MKNLLTAALAALLCSCGGANYTITGRYELPPGDSVYLLASDNTVLAAGVVNADTTVSLQGTVTTPDLVFLANAKRTNHPAWLFPNPERSESRNTIPHSAMSSAEHRSTTGKKHSTKRCTPSETNSAKAPRGSRSKRSWPK